MRPTLLIVPLALACEPVAERPVTEQLQPADSMAAVVQSSATASSGTNLEAVSTVAARTDSLNALHYTTVNRRFHVRGIRRRGFQARVVIEEAVETNCCRDGEKPSWGTVVLSGWGDPGAAASAPVWTLALEGDGGAFWGEFYRADLNGCCDSANLLTFVHVMSGKPVFWASQYFEPNREGLFRISVPNSPVQRFVAFHDVYSPSDPPEAQGRDDVVGVLQYGPPEGPVQRMTVVTEVGRGSEQRLLRVGVIGGGRAYGDAAWDLWSLNGVSDADRLSGFAIEVTLMAYDDPDVVISVPIVKDRLDDATATVPGGFRIERVRP